MLDELRAQRPDVVVLDSNALWGHMAARMLQLPTVSLMTTFVPSRAQFKRMRLREWLHTLRPMLPNIPRLMSARTHVLRRFGNAVPRPAFPASGDLNIAFFPREFQHESPRIDDTFRFVGPMILVDGGAAGEPVVYISLGTLHRGSTDFFQQCFAAFADLPMRCVLSVGNQTDIRTLGRIPANFDVQPFVSQLADVDRDRLDLIGAGVQDARVVVEGLDCADAGIDAALLFAVPLGLAAGYAGRVLDSIIGRLFDTILAFPSILLGIGLVAVLGSSILNVAIAVAIINVPTVGRLTRVAVLTQRGEEYVVAARVLGASTARILGRHILPNVVPVLLVQTALMMGEAVLLEAAFSFLGLGSRPPAPSWGTMLNSGRNFLVQAPWLGLFPGLVITVTILGLNALSDALRTALGARST
jgi:Binding-protein-dependent transport system inner membrane component